MRRTLILSVLCIGFMVFSLPAFAGSIQYDAVDLGGGDWQYNYIVNGTFTGNSNGFTIYFDESTYTNLTDITAPSADWDLLISQPVISLPMPGYFDGLALNNLTGSYNFSVDFTWLGSGTPGSQPFEFYDLNNIDNPVTGMTSHQASVPDPSSSLILLSIGFAGVAIARRKLA
jgi:hypothetical protein